MSDKENNSSPRKITLTRKKRTELKVETTPGQERTVAVEVRKRRTYVKRDEIDENRDGKNVIAEEITADDAKMATASSKAEIKSTIAENSSSLDDRSPTPDSVDSESDKTEKPSMPKDKEATSPNESEKREAIDVSEQKKVAKELEEKARQERIETAKKRAREEEEHKKETAQRQIREKERRQQEELDRLSKMARSNENAVSSIAIKFQGDDVEEDVVEAEEEALIKTPEAPVVEKAAETEERKPRRSRSNNRHRSEKREREEISIKDSRRGGGNRNRNRNQRNVQQQEHGFQLPVHDKQIEVDLGETITVADLAHKMSIKAAEVIKALMNMGTMVTINQVLDRETAAIVVEEMGHLYKFVSANPLEDELLASIEGDGGGKLVSRPPVVTIMGHVDHGKTSLLDYIRKEHVVSGEAGGITQHIGAYHVKTEKGVISFLDTPGHSAFAAMRARGAKVTDIVVLVVAADDGVMPQTLEGIQHAKASDIPVIVAMTKMDKSSADKDRIMSELSQHGIISEEWGGENLFAFVSSKTGEGIDHLLDQILVQAEVMDLKAVNEGPARGAVIESRLDRGRGPVATILVQAGLLKRGNIVLAGFEYGRLRAMIDENGNEVDSASPSIPVEIIGLSGVPNAGDEVTVVPDERKAREIANFRQGKYRDIKLARQHKAKLENLFENIGEDVTILNIVLKADVQGSVEALISSLEELSNDEVTVKVIASGVGGINESDAHLAVSSEAIVIGFNVRADSAARRIIEEEGLALHYYSVIYDVIDEIEQAIIGKLSPEFKEVIVGIAEVRDVFKSPRIGAIAGCMVTEGVVKRNNPIRVLRDNVVIYEGELESLRRFKDDVREVRSGMECGIGVKNYNDVKAGDQIEVYEQIEVKRTSL